MTTGIFSYPINLRPLSDDEGGGWLATVPDLPGCMSDGETQAEALTNIQGAITSWLEEAAELERPVPKPGSVRGEWRQRVPKSLHEDLKRCAQTEGVSLNQLVTSILARYVGDGPLKQRPVEAVRSETFEAAPLIANIDSGIDDDHADFNVVMDPDSNGTIVLRVSGGSASSERIVHRQDSTGNWVHVEPKRRRKKSELLASASAEEP